jgi:hypothetical protein
MDNIEHPITVWPKWVCGVVRSGYHNGAKCTPSDPHDPSWKCAYRYELSYYATSTSKALLEAHGIIVEEK